MLCFYFVRGQPCRGCEHLQCSVDDVHPSIIIDKLRLISVPEFAKRWKTVGLLREEDIEALHNKTNRVLANLVCVREKGLQLSLAMERLHLKTTEKTISQPNKRQRRTH